MFSDSILVRSGQMRKVIASFALVVTGALMTLVGSFFGQYVAGIDNVLFALIGLCVGFAGGAYGAMAIRCPQCGARWIWRAMSEGVVNSWLASLLVSKSCPVCNWPCADP